MSWKVGLIWLLLGVMLKEASAQDYLLCSKPGQSSFCQQIARSGVLGCQEHLHGVDCLINVNSGNTSFGIVSGAEAFLAAGRTNNIQVIGEVLDSRNVLRTQAVVIVKNDTDFQNLQGKKYCHPGFRFEHELTQLFLEQFEVKALEINAVDVCSNNGTFIEKNINALANLFGASCRPSPWTIDDNLNERLKSTYSSLCSLCENSSCDVNTDDPFKSGIECLANRDADVAFTLLDKALEFFNNSENAGKYQYLCPDGSKSGSDAPCVWDSQIRRLLVANGDVAQNVKEKLEGEFLKDITWTAQDGARSVLEGAVYQNLLKVLHLSNSQRINFTFPVSLTDYVKGYRSIPNPALDKCSSNVKWCTTSSEETYKCNWLAQASVSRGLLPPVRCVQGKSALDCLSKIQNDDADLITVDANYGYIAKKKNLAALAFPETIFSDLTVILAVVKNDSNVERFENLRGKIACLPEYGGIEFLTFIDIGRNKRILSQDSCDYGWLLSEFVGDSCVPGAIEPDHEINDSTDTGKLCRMCRSSTDQTTSIHCNADSRNNYYGSRGALTCLRDAGQFAVISKQDFTGIETDQFRVLCKNGSLASYYGLDVDNDCALAVITKSEVVSKRTNAKNEDIRILLQEYEQWFGVETKKPFELFNAFNGMKDLLFKDSTPGLDFNNSSNIYIQNYVTLFEHIDKCGSVKAGVSIPSFSFALVVFCLLIQGLEF